VGFTPSQPLRELLGVRVVPVFQFYLDCVVDTTNGVSWAGPGGCDSAGGQQLDT
jgi:hypothetical protein